MALTKVTGQVIKNTTDVTVGVLTVTNTLAVGGTVSIGGTLTYEDVTNVDAVGLITARNGIVVGSGITLSKDGDIFATGITTVSGNVKVGTGITLSPDGDVFFTGIATGNGSGLTNLPAANLTGTLPAISGANLTNLDASDLASGTVPSARLGSGTASSSTFLRGDSSFQTVNTDLVSDTSPQLGGNLDTNTHSILLNDSDGTTNRILMGTSSDLRIFHNGTDSIIQNTTGNLIIGDTTGNVILQGKYGEDSIICKPDAAVEINHDNTKVFETVSGGVKVHGTYEVNWAGGSSTYWWNNGDLVSTSSWVATKGGSGGNLVNTQGGTNGLTYSSSDSMFNGYKSIRMASGGAGGLRTSTESSGTYWNGTEAWTVMVVFEQTGHSGGTSYGDALFCQNVNTSSSTNNNGSWSLAPYGDHTWGGGWGEQFGYTGDHEPLSHMTQPFKGIFMYRTYGFEHSEPSVNFGGGWIPIQLAHSAPSSLGTTFTNISFLNFQQNSSSHEFIGGIAEMAYWKGTRVGGKELESISSYLCNKYQL